MEELIGAEAVRVEVAPGVVRADGPLGLGSDAVLPVVAGGEVATGPAEQGDAEVFGSFHDVFSETACIGKRAAFLVDAAIDAAAEVFGEIAEHVRMDFADFAVCVDLDASLRALGVG
ncbi:MAG: hypothetical protein QM757_01240 [Paludibaculum sp.]